MRLSVVIPCFNEAQVLPKTYERLAAVLDEAGETDREVIFVDDGSSDETFRLLCDLQKKHDDVRVLGLSRNFGHQMAVTAGLEEASGDATVIIDADLQDPPEVIGEMLAKWGEGFQVVYGVRDSRAGETRFKLLTAKLFYRLINRLSDTPIPSDTGDFRLLDRSVVDALMEMPERDRFLRGMVSWIGFRQCGVHYRREPRAAGRSKYPFAKMLRFAADGILSFSIVPLKLAIWVGFAAIGIAFAGIILAVLERVYNLYDINIGRGWASLFIAVLFMGGVQLLTLGIIGEYLGRIYIEVKRRPLYVVRDRLGFGKK
jgi:polyisoprenyl-phosphate glycosyltransferase